jgi:hypothetical protein
MMAEAAARYFVTDNKGAQTEGPITKREAEKQLEELYDIDGDLDGVHVYLQGAEVEYARKVEIV